MLYAFGFEHFVSPLMFPLLYWRGFIGNLRLFSFLLLEGGFNGQDRRDAKGRVAELADARDLKSLG